MAGRRANKLEGKILERAEMIVRNLPITKPQYRRIQRRLGEVFIAYGTDGDGVYHGVWGVERPTVTFRPLIAQPRVSAQQFRHDLVTNAEWFLEECEKRGLLKGDPTFGKQY